MTKHVPSLNRTLIICAVLSLGGDPLAAQSNEHPGAGEIGEPVTIANGDLRLSGSLLTPTTPGPHPAFVLLMGSGDASYRESWMPGFFPFWKEISEFLLERGHAVLLFDKPGVNASAGDWRRQSFDDRAEDAMAAVRTLASRGDIDAGRIGLVGHSQGGWIAQIAAARNPDAVAFVILLAGPAVSVSQQILDDMHGVWTCDGLSGLNYAFRRIGLRLGLGMLGLVARFAKPGYLSRIINFDPEPVLPEIRQPTLALFAEHDPLVPPRTNRTRLEQYFGVAHGNDRLVMVTVPAADHFFRASPACPGGQRRTEWAEGFFPALNDSTYWTWIRLVQ